MILAVVCVLVIGGGIYFFSNQDSSSTINKQTSNPAPKPVSTKKVSTAKAVPSPVIHNVSIVNFAFSPTSITVRKGETIVWTNKDSTPHTVTGGTNGDINSLPLSQNQTYSFAFDKTGTFSYHCKIHPSMKGTITVTN